MHCLDLGCTDLKVKQAAFPHELDVLLREKEKSKSAAKNVPEQVEGWSLPSAEKVKARCGTDLGGKIRSQFEILQMEKLGRQLDG